MRFWFGVLLYLSVSCCTFVAMQDPLPCENDEILFGKDCVPELVKKQLPQPLLCLNDKADEDDQNWEWYDASKAMAFLIEGLPCHPQSYLLQANWSGRDARIELGRKHPLCEETYLTLQGPWLVQMVRDDFSEQTAEGQTVGKVITDNIIDACVNINFRRLWRLWEQVPEKHCEGVRQALWIPYFHLRTEHPDAVYDKGPVWLHWAAITQLIYADDPDCQKLVEEADQWVRNQDELTYIAKLIYADNPRWQKLVQAADQWARDSDVYTYAWNQLTEDRNIYYVPPK